MYLSEVMTKIQKLQQTIEDAQAELQSWVEELPYTDCDHPEFGDHICDNCGEYVESTEEALKELDDFNVLVADATELMHSGLENLAPTWSHYFTFPWPIREPEEPEPKEDGDYLDSLESWQTYGPDA